MTVRRLQWSEIAAATNPPTQAAQARGDGEKADLAGSDVQRFLGEHE
jgi:hypothetical protein